MSEKKVGKRLLTWVLVLVMTLSLLPLNALADELVMAGDPDTSRTQSTEENGAYLVKSATKVGDTYKIQLESWVTGKFEPTTGSAPLDIVLVLDQSGSMAKNGKLESLKTAVTNFVAAINQNAKDNNVEHRIAIVGFASNQTEGGSNYENGAWYNTGIFVNGKLKNYQTYEGDWTNVYLTSDSKPDDGYEYSAYLNDHSIFRTDIEYDAGTQKWGYWSGFWGDKWNTITPKTDANDDNSDHIQVQRRAKEGYTDLTEDDYQAALVDSDHSDIDTAISNLSASGATRASYGMEMANKVFENNELREGSSRVVIFFTDGEPGWNGYDPKEAGRAIAQAHTTKNPPYNAKVFSVGMFDTNINDVNNVNNFMNYVSSNYPNANASKKLGSWKVTHGDKTDTKYYMTVENDNLSDVFETISGSILNPNVAADASTVLTDTLSQYFDFDGVTVENGTVTGVTVKKQKYNGDGQAWGEPESVDNVSVALDPATKTVTVKGFDYSDKENVVTDGTNGTNPSGYKLVVTFNVTPDTSCENWTGSKPYETNNDKATLANDGEEPFATVASPKAFVDTYKVEYRFDETAPNGVNPPVDSRYYISGQQADVKKPESPIVSDGHTYTFNGWKIGNDEVNGETIPISGNVTLIGTWTNTANTATYTVNYLWNGEPIPGATSAQKTAEYGTEVTEFPIEIEGYTPVKESETITIDTDNQVINLNYYKNVTLTAKSDTVPYDGEEHTVTGYTSAPEGVTFDSVTATGSGTDAGNYDVTFSANAKNAISNDKLYIVTDTKNGTLTITSVTDEIIVTITGNTDSKTYNGEEQSVTGYKVKSISNPLYEASNIKFNGNATAKGTDAVTYKMNLTAADFENTSKNFSNVTFKVTDGSLTINKCLVTITAKNVTTVYNGESPVVKDYTILREVSNGDPVNTLPTDHKIASYVTYGSGVDAGEYERFSMNGAKIVDKNGEDVTNNYEISYGYGKLTINPRNVTLTSASASKPYDGTALTSKNVTVGGDGFVEGEGATYNVTGSQTDVGKSDNEFTYELNANTKASNYNITMYKGELVITAADSVAYKVEHYKQNLDGSYNDTPNDIDPLSGTAGTLTSAAAKDYPGFTPGTVTQEKIKSDGTTTIKIQYTRNSYTLTINYVYRDGSKAAESHIETILYGKDYSVTSPKISGYTADKLVVSGTMPADNRTVTVTYTKNGGHHPRPKPTVEIEDDDALGLNTTDHFAYIVGYGNGEVRPQNNITRAEVATIFFRLLTDDVRDENLTKTNRYSDVTRADWYNTAVSTLSSMGIITGYPDGTFRPNAAITRAEFAAIAARFDSNGDKTTAKFSDIATHWAKDEISIAYNNGWITGYPNGTFGPQRDITRAETMTLVNRVLNRLPETEEDLLPNMVTWTDNADKNAWYYLAVQEATNSHYYKFKTNSKYEKWTELRETRDWTQLEK